MMVDSPDYVIHNQNQGQILKPGVYYVTENTLLDPATNNNAVVREEDPYYPRRTIFVADQNGRKRNLMWIAIIILGILMVIAIILIALVYLPVGVKEDTAYTEKERVVVVYNEGVRCCFKRFCGVFNCFMQRYCPCPYAAYG